MFTFRKEQYSVFEKNELKKFEDPTYLHLNELNPAQCQDLGEPRLRRMIQYGVQRAASYQIVFADDVRTYIDVMMLLGPDFDKDPRYPWAQNLLLDKDLKDPKLRVARLHENAMKVSSDKA